MIGLLASLFLAASQDATPRRYDDMFGAFAPDGRQLVFTSDRSGDPEIYVANVDGTGLRRLTFTPGRDAHPTWSPDGRLIAFQSPREGGDVRIYLMRPDGSDPRLLVQTEGFCGVPVWSPDSRQIAFQCSADLNRFGTAEAPWRLFGVNANGTDLRQLSFGPGNDQVPSWEADGRKLVFHSDRGGSDQLFELDLANGRTQAITSGPDVHHSASVSHGGRLIALMKGAPEAQADVHVLDRRTGEFRRLTRNGPQFGTPQISSDLRTILFQAATAHGTRLRLVPVCGGAAVEFNPREAS